MTDFGIIIPARYASTRLPGKPLREIAGKPMIQWVVENSRESGARFVLVATDDERIEKVVRDLGGDVVMTSADHATGTDRLAEVVQKREIPPDTIVVNVQGDEPFLPSEAIHQVVDALAQHVEAGVATLAHPIATIEELFDPNAVKVVLDDNQFASYFSRAPVPWVHDAFAKTKSFDLPANVPFLRHIGLYAYRAQTLVKLAQLSKTPLELAESLEQLRALHHGVRIAVQIVNEAFMAGIDTEADLQRAQSALLVRATG